MSYLVKAKQHLTSIANDIFNDMRHDLDFNEYKDHYASLGETMASIDKHESISTLLKSVLKGEFDHLGVFCEDDECLEEFLEKIFKKSC